MTPTQQAAVGGAVCFVVCAVLTAWCAIAAEVLGYEPALRGLVHAGVMLLFAGICVEPMQRYNHDALLLEDAQGMGIFFSGMAMIQLTSIGINSLLRKQLDESYLGLSWCVSFAGCLAIFWILLKPVIQQSQEQCGGLKSLFTLGLFALATLSSLLDTVQSLSDTSSHYTLVLDLMAYVFHRAFIGTMLAGAGFGTSRAIVEATARSNLRCRYRAFFSIVCINLSASWRRHTVSSLGVLAAGLLQFDEVIAVVGLLYRTSSWQWPIRRNADSQGNSFLQTTSGNLFVGNAYLYAVLSFIFYSGTLFADGVLLQSEHSSNQDTGFDECLVKAVHVAAVLSSMVAIFPRLLLIPSTTGDLPTRFRPVHNAIVKIVCASMSTMDVIICTLILWQDQTSTQEPMSVLRRNVLYLRCLGAILEAVTFAVLQVRPWNHSEPSGCEDTVPLTDDRQVNGGTTVDGAAMVTWLVYFGAHVYHSCVDPIGRDTIALELQLSKIFHFQVITIGFYSSSILRTDPMSMTIVSVFAWYEILGVVACGRSLSKLSLDQYGMVIGSLLLLMDCMLRLMNHDPAWIIVAKEKKQEGAGAVLFPS